jgi:hypothetical protein
VAQDWGPSLRLIRTSPPDGRGGDAEAAADLHERQALLAQPDGLQLAGDVARGPTLARPLGLRGLLAVGTSHVADHHFCRRSGFPRSLGHPLGGPRTGPSPGRGIRRISSTRELSFPRQTPRPPRPKMLGKPRPLTAGRGTTESKGNSDGPRIVSPARVAPREPPDAPGRDLPSPRGRRLMFRSRAPAALTGGARSPDEPGGGGAAARRCGRPGRRAGAHPVAAWLCPVCSRPPLRQPPGQSLRTRNRYARTGPRLVC